MAFPTGTATVVSPTDALVPALVGSFVYGPGVLSLCVILYLPCAWKGAVEYMRSCGVLVTARVTDSQTKTSGRCGRTTTSYILTTEYEIDIPYPWVPGSTYLPSGEPSGSLPNANGSTLVPGDTCDASTSSQVSLHLPDPNAPLNAGVNAQGARANFRVASKPVVVGQRLFDEARREGTIQIYVDPAGVDLALPYSDWEEAVQQKYREMHLWSKIAGASLTLTGMGLMIWNCVVVEEKMPAAVFSALMLLFGLLFGRWAARKIAFTIVIGRLTGGSVAAPPFLAANERGWVKVAERVAAEQGTPMTQQGRYFAQCAVGSRYRREK